ncbi:MAG: glycosyltransferase family 2 protein [Thermoanaerobaculia bacterium]
MILTKNEELNLPFAVDSVTGWSKRVIVLDSGSSDNTEKIARAAGCEFVFHKFENYSAQRNFALSLIPDDEWVLFLDADEWLTPELRDEIAGTLASNPAVDGFFIKRRLIWMGRWIKRGYYPVWILRLSRAGRTRCDDRGVNEHLIIDGVAGYLENDFMHEDRRGVDDWVAKHNRYASLEADLLLVETPESAERVTWKTQEGRKRWVRERLWKKLPPLIRPFFYFTYRYIFRGGFMDGVPAFTYHFLQGLWYPFLVDVKYLEKRRAMRKAAT